MTLNGLDISNNQPTTPNLSGVSFVIVKATEGTWHDPMWPTHSANVVKAGKTLGAYEFGVDGLDGVIQANQFLAVIGHSTKLVALDVEGAHATHPDQIKAWMATCNTAGMTTLLYASEGNWPGGVTGTKPNIDFGQHGNWVAKWGRITPSIPWMIWQNRGAPLDLDVFNGTQAQLNALAGIAAPGPAPAPTPAPKPVTYTLHIAHGAVVQVVPVNTALKITGDPVPHPWPGKASSAPCSATKYLDGIHSGGALCVKVGGTSGPFKDEWVHSASQGVSVTHS